MYHVVGKAGYTAIKVACRWEGAVMLKAKSNIWAGIVMQKAPENANDDQWTDRPTNQRAGKYVEETT